jgi:hypothetical protein
MLWITNKRAKIKIQSLIKHGKSDILGFGFWNLEFSVGRAKESKLK